VFSISIFLWSAQAIYARAFFASGNTFVPMVAGTTVTLVSWPIYAALYHWHGAMGLAVASDIGIAIQTGTIAVLLHQRHMVSLAGLDYKEMGRCLLAGTAAGAVVWAIIWGVSDLPFHLLHTQLASAKRWTDLGVLVVGSAVWIVIAKWVLERTGSALPSVAMKRLGMGRTIS